MRFGHFVAVLPMVTAMACAGGPRPEPQSLEVRATGAELPAPPPPVQPTPVGSWRGSYVCTQGMTGLDLTVGASAAGHLTAQFRFYGLPGNPTVPSGLFAMSGRIAPDGRVELFATEEGWIEQPPRFMVVGLSGTISGDNARWSGVVTHGDGSAIRDCSTFSLLRQQ